MKLLAARCLLLLLPLGLTVSACGDDTSPTSQRDATTPDGTTPDGTTPDGTTPDATTPDGTIPDGTTPDTHEPWDDIVDRLPGAREPLVSPCDPRDTGACHLPWPTGTALQPDASTPTGLRLLLDLAPYAEDEGVDLINARHADGFSRVTPIVASLPPGTLYTAGTLRLFTAQGPNLGAEIPLSTKIYLGRSHDRDVITALPLVPLEPATEYLVVMTGFRTADAPLPTEPFATLALGLRPPTTRDEALWAAYAAPHRALLATHHPEITPESINRLWDFTTRSADDPRKPLRAVAEAARRGVTDVTASIHLDRANVGSSPIDLVVSGRVDDLVDPTEPEDSENSHYSAPFRIAIPEGEGNYPIVMYCHGAGGSVDDDSFDPLITGFGAAKVGIEIDGWTGDTMMDAVLGLTVPLTGTDAMVRRMRRAIAGINAVHLALETRLGALLSAPTMFGLDNLAAGRAPRADHPLWAGGSLGGTMGLVYGNLEPKITGGVLNVPGAGYTHWLSQSSLAALLELALEGRYTTMSEQQLILAMSQTIWDEVDGAVWADARETPPVFLIQLSVGDPIMPNVGSALVATAMKAVLLLPEGQTPMLPVALSERAPSAAGRSTLTEYRTNATKDSDIHGFAATDFPAGLAARAQIEAFMPTLWNDAPFAYLPGACLDKPVACDFAP